MHGLAGAICESSSRSLEGRYWARVGFRHGARAHGRTGTPHDGLPHLSLVFLRRLSPQGGGRSLARPPLSLAERLLIASLRPRTSTSCKDCRGRERRAYVRGE